jgi:hypothetical protein
MGGNVSTRNFGRRYESPTLCFKRSFRLVLPSLNWDRRRGWDRTKREKGSPTSRG